MSMDEITMTEGSFKTHEVDEWFPGQIDRIEEGEDYGYGPTIRFVLTLDGDDFEEWALASQKLSPRSKLYRWVNGIDPTAIPEIGQTITWEKLVARRVEVMYELVEGEVRLTKMRAEKKTVEASGMQKKQAAAAKAKTVTDDEAPF